MRAAQEAQNGIAETLVNLNTTREGLQEAQANARLERDGLNEVTHDKPPHALIQLLMAFNNPFIYVLAILAGISFFTDYWLPTSHGEDGDLTTPLVDDAQCAYTYTENGVTLCAIEKAWAEGKTPFRKPISCHLYPIRVMRFSNGTVGLNYHRWSVCAPARRCGARLGIPVYKALREPIVRRFGEEFYKALEAAEELIKQQ